MFFVIYLHRELQRRMRQMLLIAMGLAVGIGLVVTVTAAAAGVGNAQGTVLHALYGIGTDVTITTAQQSGTSRGAGRPLITSGDASTHDDFLALPLGLGVLNASAVAALARLHGVVAAAAGLSLVETKLTVGPVTQPGQLPSLSATTVTVDGVDLARLTLGPFAAGTIGAGRSFAASDASAPVAVVDSAYARAHKLTVGATITIAKTTFRIIGIVRQPQGGGSADVYIPLGRAQALTSDQNRHTLAGKVDVIYVAAASAADIPGVQARIAKRFPLATVTSSSTLANAVSGSLASAARLARDLGRWLAVAVLSAAFAVASLLTMASVARRVREFGTLKALGWRSRRIIAQIMAESIVVGLLGAVLGSALGCGGAAVIDAIAPTLSATVAQNPGSSPPQGALINGTGLHTVTLPGGTHTVAVHMSAPINLTTILLAVALAIGGALLAGAFGGWRAARLRPAEALARVE